MTDKEVKREVKNKTEEKSEEIKPADVKKKTVAKAGKRSEKSLKESKEKTEKVEKQKLADKPQETAKTHKSRHETTKARFERRGKKYREVSKTVDKSKLYSLDEALSLATKTSTTKFDSTVEVHVRLNVDPKQADQNIRDSVILPSGTGKNIRVAVYSDDQNIAKAKQAGADIAESEDFLARLDKEKIDFDVLIATPNVMQKLAKYARLLGPKGLMPNPKSGTVTADVEKAVKQSKAGKVEYRVDSYGIVHSAIGKTSFGLDKLKPNAEAILNSIKQNKPGSLKGAYVSSINITTTMGPSIKVQTSEI